MAKKQPKQVNQESDQTKPADKIETRGRKNRGQTELSYEIKKEEKKLFKHVVQPSDFSGPIIERVQGEIIDETELNQFKELYKCTIETILNRFRDENPELIKKNPYYYYKRILIRVKHNVPAVTAKDIDKLIIIWDVLKEFMEEIGLFITYETFENLTSVYKYQIQKYTELSPKYADFMQKINKDCDTALINDLSFNPYNSANKIFIAKCRGIVEKTEPKQIEVTHKVRNYDELPMNNIDFSKIE